MRPAVLLDLGIFLATPRMAAPCSKPACRYTSQGISGSAIPATNLFANLLSAMELQR